MVLLTNEIRKLFVNFFAGNGHKVVPSSPLVPKNDPSLMFTNSGMVQFKNVFTGFEKVNFNTAVSSQKCLRVGGKHNDLENVGHTNRHHTFFEMLGNFSFGDYFKERAIELAWNFITKELQLDKERLYLTVYHTDDEAYNFWKKITGFADNKIIKIATDDNFWSMGNTGPCGPCSEIFYDYGDVIPGGPPGSKDADGDRFVEIWNLVFMQYDRDDNGQLRPLPKKCVDTGMGLERIASVMQGKHDNYETDLFAALINESKVKSGNSSNKLAHRIIADHLRAAAFLIAEGIMPSNEGRNYVLRRIIRRATRYIYQLGGSAPLLYQVFPALIEQNGRANMSDAYPELLQAKDLISDTLHAEEVNFAETLVRGLAMINKAIEHLPAGDVLSGDLAFKLYDTYGFPLDITLDIAREKGLRFDQNSFDCLMQEQKDRARGAWVGSGEQDVKKVWFNALNTFGKTKFSGYEESKCQGTVLSLISHDTEVEAIGYGQEFYLLLDKTPFYAESGGQIGDSGLLTNDKVKIRVLDTKKQLNGLHVHRCQVEWGEIAVGSIVTAEIDVQKRKALRTNHSATHLLHYALKSILGNQVAQKGSLVAVDKIRFDFNYQSALTAGQIMAVEELVNKMIRNNSAVSVAVQGVDDAISSGALALFGEKYEDEVRVITMGESKELCGGTHVKYTGEIGVFKITSENSVAFGIRRIEAITGDKAIDLFRKKEALINSISATLKVKDDKIIERLEQLLTEKKQLEGKRDHLYMMLAKSQSIARDLVADVTVITHEFYDIPANIIKDLALEYSNQPKTIVIFLSTNGAKSVLVLRISKDTVGSDIAMKLTAETALVGKNISTVVQLGGDVTKMRQVASNIRRILLLLP